MIDSGMVRQIQPTLNQFALDWVPKWLRANAVTVMGFLVGLLVLPLLRDQAYLLALIVILFNRFLDGLDGAIARRDGISDFGGFLDICCDFIFYSAVVPRNGHGFRDALLVDDLRAYRDCSSKF